MAEYRVDIRGELTDDDGLRIEMPRTTPYQAWHEIPLPACPDCGGNIVWAEAGHVPGTRQCVACGSLFSVQAGEGKVFLRRERLY